MTKLRIIYDSSPLFVQNFLISAYGYYWKNRRFGGNFKKQVLEFKSREKFSNEEWTKYQTLELRKLLIHSFETVPYYNSLYKDCGFKKKDFLKFTIKDIKELPYLEKEALRKYGTSSLLSSKRSRGKFYSSSGSTGTPTSIFLSKDVHRKWSALYEARVRNWAGVHYKMRRGMIGGREILKDSNASAPFYRINRAENQVYFSAYHISKSTFKSYLEGIEKKKIDYMVGYAKSNFFLAGLFVENNIKIPLKAVLCSSEILTDEMRETFFKAYGCKTFNAYSGVEACGLISENLFGDFLFSPDSGILEVINEKGFDVSYGEEGEVVSTGFFNYDQPLIRYRIGDRLKLSQNQKTKSGLSMPKVEKIEGRVEDVLKTRDGRKIVSLYKIFIGIKGIKLSQVIQYNYHNYEIKIVIDKLFDDKDQETIRNRFINRIDSNSKVKINIVDDIPKTKSGKYKQTISLLDE